MKKQRIAEQYIPASADRISIRVPIATLAETERRHCPGALATCVVMLASGISILSLPVAARAQSYYTPELSAQVTVDQNQITNSVYNATSPVSESYANGVQTGFSIANYGLLGGSGSVTSSGTDSNNLGNDSDNISGFTDSITIAAAGPPTEIVPTTVTFSLFGNSSISPGPVSDIDSEGRISIIIKGIWSAANVQGTLISQNTYSYAETLGNEIGSSTPTTTGSLSFTTNLQNDTTYFFSGNLEVEASAAYGASTVANYQNTSVFNISSTLAGTTYTGSQGTNYSTLNDPTASASAPEPGSAALALAGISPFAAAGFRRLRRIRTTEGIFRK